MIVLTATEKNIAKTAGILQAIKSIRNARGGIHCSLVEAKEAVEAYLLKVRQDSGKEPVDPPLVAHAKLTIQELERRLKHRGMTTGKRRWELQLLKSAYVALALPVPNGSALIDSYTGKVITWNGDAFL